MTEVVAGTNVKALPTAYGGVTFRSRLEARWAVFFDSLGLAWQYEPEGYETPDGWYLPDFWLPGIRHLLEVKPRAPSEHEQRLLAHVGEALAVDVAAVLIGPPELPDGFSGDEYSHLIVYPRWDYPYWWCECGWCKGIGLQFEGRSFRLACGCANGKGLGDRGHRYDSLRLERAYAAATAYRFVR